MYEAPRVTELGSFEDLTLAYKGSGSSDVMATTNDPEHWVYSTNVVSSPSATPSSPGITGGGS